MKRNNKSPCAGCVWGTMIDGNKCMCLFPSCVEKKLQDGQKSMTEEWMKPERREKV